MVAHDDYVLVNVGGYCRIQPIDLRLGKKSVYLVALGRQDDEEEVPNFEGVVGQVAEPLFESIMIGGYADRPIDIMVANGKEGSILPQRGIADVSERFLQGIPLVVQCCISQIADEHEAIGMNAVIYVSYKLSGILA
jgi:hypothetical protein